jgi:hypothetical protein
MVTGGLPPTSSRRSSVTGRGAIPAPRYTLITGDFYIRYPDLPRHGPEPDGVWEALSELHGPTDAAL